MEAEEEVTEINIDNLIEQKMVKLDDDLRRINWPFDFCDVHIIVRNRKAGKADVELKRKLD